jgi:hypothetical protein
MNGQRHPWQRPLLPQFVEYFLAVGALTASTVALLYILLDSPV